MPGDSDFFAGMPTFMTAIFILIFVMIAVTIGTVIAKAIKNSVAPILAVEARVVAKRTDVTSQVHSDVGPDGSPTGHHHDTTTWHYATFELETGERIEFSIGGRWYGMLVVGDEGRLTYQGEWFKDFKRI